MKKLFIVGLLLLTSFVHSQNLSLTVQESKVFKMTTPRVQNDYILPDGKGGFITISTKRSGFLANPLVFESYATYYNNDLEQVRQKTFKLNKGSIKGSIKGAFINDAKLNMLNLETNYRKRYISFKRIIADMQNAETQEKEFFRIEGIYPKNEVNLYVNLNSLFYEKMKYYSDVNFFNPKIFIKFSKNNRYFAIVHRDFDKHKTHYVAHVFNKDFQEVFVQNLYNNNPVDLFYINDVLVDDQTGSVYLAAKIYQSNPLMKRRLINTDNLKKFVLYHLNKSGTQSIDIKPGKVIEQIHLIRDNDFLVAYGFYRNRYIDLNDIDGIFRMNIDVESFQKSTETYKNFSKKLVSTDYKKAHKKTKNHKMIVRKSYLLPDGSLLINSEDFYIPLMMKKKDRETEIREIVGDIFSIKVDNQGKVLWSKRIYKEQVVKPRLSLHSYFSAFYNGSNYIIFTDTHLKKQAKSDPFYLSGKDLHNLYGVVINNYGSLKEGLIKDNKRSKFRFMPIEGTVIKEGQVIIPAKDHQFIKFYKIKLN